MYLSLSSGEKQVDTFMIRSYFRRIFLCFSLFFILFRFVYPGLQHHRSMAEELLRITSDEEIANLVSKSDSVFHRPNTSATCTTTRRTTSAKSRTTTQKAKKQSVDSRISCLEKKLDDKFSSIFELVQSLGKSNIPQAQDTEGLARQIPVSQAQDDRPSGVSEPVFEVSGPSGMRRPLIPLSNDLNIEYGLQSERVQDDLISLTPGQKEKDSLGLLSDDDVRSCKSSDTVHSLGENIKSNRFCQYLADKPTDNAQNGLKDLFGDDVGSKESNTSGICLNQAQTDILSKSWRCENPEKLSAFKEENRSFFPIHEKSLSSFQVPSLDELLEPMLRKKHGSKTMKGWGKSRQLASQPLKSIESVAYQGQIAARYGLLSVAYIQQALGTLLNNLQSDTTNVDSAIQSVRDIFAMSTKALDQVGRSGAFHHIIRRKAAASDTGLNNLKDVQAKVLYLPLTGDGVFGKGLEENLKKRKEQKEQLSDLVPEFADSKTDNNRKRKSSFYDNRGSWNNKRSRNDYSSNRNTFNRFSNQSYQPGFNDYKAKSNYDYKGKSTKDNGGSFRFSNNFNKQKK